MSDFPGASYDLWKLHDPREDENESCPTCEGYGCWVNEEGDDIECEDCCNGWLIKKESAEQFEADLFDPDADIEF